MNEIDEIDKKLEEHKRFAKKSRKTINKLIAQNDPLYSSRYQQKRNMIMMHIQTKSYEINCLNEKLERYKKQLQNFLEKLRKLDVDYKNFEPM